MTEGTQPSAVGQGYPSTPGLHTDAQVKGWQLVADAVHAQDAVVFAQLMHAGRIGHTLITGQRSVAPSPVTTAGEVFTPEGMKPFEEPRELADDELPGVIAEFVDAARRARQAGLDGVELHAANGYLLHQFLSDSTNVRSGPYGGSPEDRARFVVDVATAVATEVGADRVGIRISALTKQFTGPTIASTGFTGPSTLGAAQETVDSGRGELFAIGRDYLANPDLVARLRTGAPLNEQRQELFYGGGGGAEGYTDYPAVAS